MTTVATCCLLILSLVIGQSIALDSGHYLQVGCYNDKQENPRPLPELIHNYRLDNQIDWNDLQGSVIEPCAREARKRNYLYFGVQFYGECWGGPRAHETYSRDGESSNCKQGVGKQNTNMVYSLTGEENECYDYHVLNTKERSVLYDIKVSDHDYACDDGYEGGPFEQGWYRFQGDAGSLMNDKPINYRCLTRTVVWYKGSYPEVTQGIVDGNRACFSDSKPCVDFVYIRVRNCGKFYVYDLKRIPGCSFRYCGNGTAVE